MKDEYVIVLDFLPRGHSHSRKSEPIVQGIGDKFLSLLEVAMKDGIAPRKVNIAKLQRVLRSQGVII